MTLILSEGFSFIFLYYISHMNEILFRKNFNRFTTIKYKDSLPIQYDLNFEDNVYLTPFEIETKYTDPETYQEQFNNLFYSVSKEYCTILIEKSEKKISLKFYYGYKKRNIGKPYFQLSKNVEFITVDILNGDVYVGFVKNYQKKRKNLKQIRKNYFAGYSFSAIISYFKNFISSLSYKSDDIESLNLATQIFINEICPYDTFSTLTKEEKLIKFHFNKKGVKYPNNFKIFLPYLHGKNFRKIFKKKNKRLVDSFMEYYELSGKKLKKYLHTANNLNIQLYKFARNLFGEDRLNQDGDIILSILNCDEEIEKSFINLINIKDLFSQEEMKKIYKLFKKTFIEKEINSYTFLDHMMTYQTLKNYGEKNMKWMSDGSDIHFFKNEHLDWSEKLNHYRKGEYKRIYPNYFYKELQEKIDDFFPVILNDSKSYNDESFVQSNCVKNYIGKSYSFIISLRKGGINSETRATIEYRVSQLPDGKIWAERCQSLGRFNNTLENFWYEPILKLDKKVLSCFENKLFESFKLKKICSNGVELFSDSKFDSEGNLVWTFEKNLNYLQEW